MKAPAIISSLVLISLGCGANANDSSISLRGSMVNNRRALRVQHPCTLVEVETEYEGEFGSNGRERMYNGSGNHGTRRLHNDDVEIKCELQEEDRVAVGKYFVSINGIENSQLENIVSGDTTMLAEGAMIMDGEMWLPADAAIEFGSNEENNRRLQSQSSKTHGIKKVLVVRADAEDSSTTASKETISDKVFGTYGDTGTLKSQYLACSHGKLDFQPFEGMTTGGTTVEDGVLDVTIDTKVVGASRFEIEDALEEAADKLVGSLRDQFDHVMLCLPPGSKSSSNRNWIAYGYVNSWLTVYNDDFCKSMSIQVHEMGHNLGLAHSAKDGVSYGDKSGMMGFSYNRDNGPTQCFNPAKSYQLGWFDEKVVTVNPYEGTWVGTVIGAADYSNAIVDPNAHIVVKIVSGTGKDLYVGYNRKKRMNSGVPLAGDSVTVIEQGQDYSQSDFLAGLSKDSSYTFNNFGGNGKNLVVKFVDHGLYYDEAVVAIFFDTCVYPSCCQGSKCGGLVDQIVEKPSVSLLPPVSITPPENAPQPTSAPTVAPKPTAAPTIAPKPTAAPTRGRLYSYNPNTYNRPKQLVNEYFRNDLGVFNNDGSDVQQNMFQYVLTAKFQMNNMFKPPSISTNLDLQGSSLVQVNFWYNAEKMQSDEGFILQYSENGGSLWKDVRNFKFGEDGFNRLDVWNFAKSETFEVPEGTGSTKVRFVGSTKTNNSDSVFYIAGVSIYGVSQ